MTCQHTTGQAHAGSHRAQVPRLGDAAQCNDASPSRNNKPIKEHSNPRQSLLGFHMHRLGASEAAHRGDASHDVAHIRATKDSDYFLVRK